MKFSYILAGALVALFAIPATATQMAVRTAATAPLIGSAPGASTGGLFSDPNAAPQFSIALPTKFEALDIGSHPLASFRS